VFEYPPDGIILNTIKKISPESKTPSTAFNLTPREYPKLISHKFKRTFYIPPNLCNTNVD